MSRILWVLLALAAGVVGFALGQHQATNETSPAVAAYREAASEAAAEGTGSSGGATAGEEGAILSVLREPDPFARAEKLAATLATLGPGSAAEAQQVLEDRSLELGAVEHGLLVDFWASHDPEVAADWALWRSPLSFRKGLMLPVFERWARVDPEAARDKIFAISLAPAAPADVAAIGLVRGWYASGKPGLDRYLQALGQGFEQQRGLAALARQISLKEGPEAVMRWAEALPEDDEKFKLAAYRQTGSELAQLDPTAAAAWCEAHCDGPFGSMVRSLVAQRWATQQGRAAMDWVEDAPPGKEKDWAVKAAFRGWWRSDPDGLNAWAAELRKDGLPAWFQPAIENYAIALSRRQPTDAVDWALEIEDEATRERTLVTVARNWRNSDEAAAEAWLAQSPLSEEARERARLPAEIPRPQRARPTPGDTPDELRGLGLEDDVETETGSAEADPAETAAREGSAAEAPEDAPQP